MTEASAPYREYAVEEYILDYEPYYVPISDEVGLFEAAYEQKIPVLLKGPTGCGKTRFVEHMAFRLGRPLTRIKDVGGAGLVRALRQALAGDMPLSTSVRRELVSSVVEHRPTVPADGADVGLSAREHEALSWLAQGLGNQQIAAQMSVSEGSVKQYLVSIGRKLGVRARTGILVRAIQLGLVDPHALPPVQD